LSRIYPELAYVVMRPAFMAAEHCDADWAVGTPRAEHIAFYRRAFGATVWRPPRDYPGLTAKLSAPNIASPDNSSNCAIPFSNPIRWKET
jgi:hypothetical protein